MRYLYHFETQIGRIALVEENDQITNLFFENDPILSPQAFSGVYTFEVTPLLHEAYRQLCEYFEGTRKSFDLPLCPQGTEFMMAVWREIAKIPYGETATYREIAERIGKPKAARTVGLANNRNPLPIFYPCHRVVGQDGKLVGYRGGMEVKRMLLELEKKNK